MQGFDKSSDTSSFRWTDLARCEHRFKKSLAPFAPKFTLFLMQRNRNWLHSDATICYVSVNGGCGLRACVVRIGYRACQCPSQAVYDHQRVSCGERFRKPWKPRVRRDTNTQGMTRLFDRAFYIGRNGHIGHEQAGLARSRRAAYPMSRSCATAPNSLIYMPCRSVTSTTWPAHCPSNYRSASE